VPPAVAAADTPADSFAGHHRSEVGLWLEILLEVHSDSDHDHPGLLPTQPSDFLVQAFLEVH